MNDFGCFVVTCEEGTDTVTYVVAARSSRAAVNAIQKHPGERRVIETQAITWSRVWEVQRTTTP